MIRRSSCVLLVLTGVLSAQDPGAGASGGEPVQVSSGEDEGPIETALERAQRDQVRVGLRLESLRQKMERLAQRYEDEGRARNAELLRGAMTRFDETPSDNWFDRSRLRPWCHFEPSTSRRHEVLIDVPRGITW